MMLLDKLQSYRVVLASKSPRRKALLAGLGLNFEIFQSDEPEIVRPEWSPEEVVRQLSCQKASHVFSQLSASDPQFPLLVIGGDTIVVSEGRILGKPANRDEACQMLCSLSGKTHVVHSGLCLMTASGFSCESDTAEVTFDRLENEEIYYYIDHFHPFDKAGSYGVQEWIGYRAISCLKGSFYTVMGLPTHLLWKMLVNMAGL